LEGRDHQREEKTEISAGNNNQINIEAKRKTIAFESRQKDCRKCAIAK
jgi:hypothetical protein